MLAYRSADWDAVLDALSTAVTELATAWELPWGDAISVAFDARSWAIEGANTEGLGSTDRGRMLSELKETLKMVGPEFAKLTSSQIREIEAINDLAHDGALEALDAFIKRSLTGEAAVAAWDDLVSAAERLPRGVESEFTYHKNLLSRILEELGFRVGFQGDDDLADGTLKNSSFSVERVLRRLGRESEAQPITLRLERRDIRSAELGRAQRLALVRDFWRAQSPRGQSIVWLQYISARIDDHNPVSVGPATFYAGDILVQLLQWEVQDERVPDELWAARHSLTSWLPPNEAGYVLVRVKVDGPYSNSADEAEQIVDAILSLYRTSEKQGWLRTNASAQFRGGQLGMYRLRTTRERSLGIHFDSSLGNALSAEATRFVPENLTLTPDLIKAARAAEQLRGNIQGGPQEVIISAVRVLEEFRRDFFPDLGDWSLVASKILRSHWSFTRAYRALEHAVMGVSSDEAEAWLKDATDQPRYQQQWTHLANRYWSSSPTLVEVAFTGRTLFSMLDPSWYPASRLKNALRLASNDPTVARRPVNAWMRGFDSYLVRLERCRNSIQHGRVVDSATLSSLENFAYECGRIAAILRAEAVMRSEPARVVAGERHEVAERAIEMLRLGYWEAGLSNPS